MQNLEVNKIYTKKDHLCKYNSFLKIVKITKMFVFYSSLDSDSVYRESIKNFTERIKLNN